MRTFAVYILCNEPYGTLYVGFTNDLVRRMHEHRSAVVDSFTKQYALKQLVYIEPFKYVNDAIAREKQLKRWQRQWKINAIDQTNPDWRDLAVDLLGMEPVISVEKNKGMDPGFPHEVRAPG